MGRNMRKSEHLMVAMLAPLALAVVQSFAQAATPVRIEEGLEGPGELRDAYMASRRQGPTADFDAAAARNAAAQQKINTPPVMSLPSAYQHTEVWQAVGPAP